MAGSSMYPTVLGSTARPKLAPRAWLKPLTDAQIAQQQLAPVIARITGTIQGQAQRAGEAVKGYTASLAEQLAKTDYASPYRQAVPEQAAVDAALQQSLAGKGSQLAQELSGRLASIKEPAATDPAVAATAQFGQGTGNAALATGSAALSALLANQAAAGEYGAKQPGIARSAGLQGLGRVQGQAVSDIAEQTAPLYAKLPDIVSGIQTNRARNQQLAFENRLAGFKATTGAEQGQQRLAQGQARLGISARNSQIAAQRAADASARGWKALGLREKSMQQTAAAREKKLKSGGFTPVQVQKFKGAALTLASQAYAGAPAVVDPNTGRIRQPALPKLTYRQAILEGQKEGIPLSILLPELERAGYVTPAVARKQAQIAGGLFPDLFAGLANR